MPGHCPSCGETITELSADVVPVKSDASTKEVVAFRCEHCSVVLGCQTDPHQMEQAIQRHIEEAFRRRGML